MDQPSVTITSATIEDLVAAHVAKVYGVTTGAVDLHCVHRRGDDGAVDYSAQVQILPREEEPLPI